MQSQLLTAPKLLEVPQALPEKIYTTERVGISRKTHDEHLKLWIGYTNKTNEIRKALAEIDLDPAKANQIYSQMRALKINYAFAYGGYVNHLVYFHSIGGEGGPATGDIATLIKESFGTFEHWAADWKATGIAGRGWAFLAYDHLDQRVHTYMGDSQDTYPAWNNTLLLGLDVYEHAYYLDFQTARAKYIDAYMQVIDWGAANARLAKALGR
ncbi:MAG: superoxide dismutase [Fimbriimonas ginsengisoli]|uniref:superoxide dismutase n=1 Tax=Fimbriimonas ginsengisoli TaxID=1005039 RepID=A0A931PWD6_FIMGI|nr:superoxide dismutase [Fimbriimonas ginsengisoli]